MGVLGLLNQVFYIKGMSLGDAAAMAPIHYTRLVFAIIVGLAFFHEVPNWVTMLARDDRDRIDFGDHVARVALQETGAAARRVAGLTAIFGDGCGVGGEAYCGARAASP